VIERHIETPASSSGEHEAMNGGDMNQVSNQTTALMKVISAGNAVLDAPTLVADVMTKDTMTLRPQQSFAEVVGLMANQSFRHVLVIDSDERLQGVISDRDVLRALSRTPDWSKKSVSEIMTRDSITSTPDSPISVAVRLMLEKRINCLPVIGADGRVCGILTSTDLLMAYEKIQTRLEESAT
jgi:CBS domain-containing protein